MRIFLFLIYITFSLSAITNTEWYRLEQEVEFDIWSSKQIDSLREKKEVFDGEDPPHVYRRLPSYDKAVYRLRWGILNVGYGYLENERRGDKQINSAKAVTSGLVGHIIRVRNLSWSYGSADGLYPLFFRESNFEEGLTSRPFVREKWTIYDNLNGRVLYEDRDELKENEAEPYTHNYISLLYALRNSSFVAGDTVVLPAYVHGKQYDIQNVVHGIEMITVDRQNYRCWKIQPILVGEGHGFNENDLMYIWIDVHYPHQMIQARADARLGRVHARLIHREERR